MTAVFQYISDYIFNFYMGFKKKKLLKSFCFIINFRVTLYMASMDEDKISTI